MSMKEILIRLLNSLNQIEVKGKENVDILLGCIVVVEKMIESLSEEENIDGEGE